MTFLERVLAHRVDRASVPAFVHYERRGVAPATIGWPGFLDRVDDLRATLAPVVERRAISVLIGYSSIDLLAAVLAVCRLGGAPAILPPASPRQDRRYFAAQQAEALRTIAPGALITVDYDLPEPDAAVARHRVTLAEGRIAAHEEHTGLQAREVPAGTLFVQHTSGTTGIKKGIPFPSDKLVCQLGAYAAALTHHDASRFQPRIASWLPFYHDMGFVGTFLLNLYCGGTLSFVDPFAWTDDPTLLFEIVEREAAEYVWMPNFAFRHLTRLSPRGTPHDLSSVRQWINCSEPCKPDVVEAFVHRLADAGVTASSQKCCYAMAETIFAISQTPVAEGSCGRRFASHSLAPGVVPVEAGPDDETAIVVASNGPLLAGVRVKTLVGGRLGASEIVGELCVRAPFLFDGYVGTGGSDAFVEGYYRTGDLGFVRDGEIHVCGRLKDVIIVFGRNIVGHEVESALQDVPGIRPGRVVAFGVYSERVASEELCIVAEGDGSNPRDAEEAILAHVHQRFGVACKDVRVLPERWLVKSSSGKISREQNRAKYLAELVNEGA